MKHLVRTVLGLAALLAMALAVPAQTADRWIQVEAQSGLPDARAAASRYARTLDRVEGFRLGATDWHAIVLGPFSEAEARERRRVLRSRRQIPADSFVTDGRSFRARFWPDPDRVVAPPEATAAAPSPDSAPAPQPARADETPAEARRSEEALSRAAREELQVALRWAGFYDARIDGAFGRGTRAAMGAYQEARGFEATGILTTAQRRALIAEYDAVLEGLDMGPVSDPAAGIAIDMPRALVRRDRVEPPFVHYGPTEDGAPYRVLLISQAGDRAELHGLYDIMQTLEIVPEGGPRERRDTSFILTGANDKIVSHTEARLRDGQVKGFTLIWRAGDEGRRTRVVDAMSASFASDPAIVLPDTVGAPSEDQGIDLLAGLQIRRPEIVRSGLYVSPEGAVLTTADAARGCGRITLNNDIDATVRATDEARGVALLSPAQPLAPRAHASFRDTTPRLQDKAVLAGYSFDGALGAPSLSYGTLADLRGLDGDAGVNRFAIEVQPSDAGGPILDTAGGVMGMLVPPPTGDRVLPEGVAFAADVTEILAFLAENGIDAPRATDTQDLPRGRLESRATDMTVLVGCWP